jgi:hypothetical protein
MKHFSFYKMILGGIAAALLAGGCEAFLNPSHSAAGRLVIGLGGAGPRLLWRRYWRNCATI